MAVIDRNISATTLPGLAGPSLRSVRVTTYAAVDDRTEVAWQDARFCTIDCFDRTNQGGTFMGTATIDLGSQTLGDLAGAGTLDDAIIAQFG